MILWPAGMALALVWGVFRDPAFDHRVVMLGAVLPDLLDGPFGGARVAHTLAFSVVLLVAVMALTRRRRAARRRWLALPIGTFAHLIFDGAWTLTRTFWWPASGSALSDPLPALTRGWTVLVLQELVGLAVLAWFWGRFNLADPQARTYFWATGRVKSRPSV
ncbi:MAG: hypothetical protein ACT4OS_08355 [Acidimicrobiales bacterium]